MWVERAGDIMEAVGVLVVLVGAVVAIAPAVAAWRAQGADPYRSYRQALGRAILPAWNDGRSGVEPASADLQHSLPGAASPRRPDFRPRGRAHAGVHRGRAGEPLRGARRMTSLGGRVRAPSVHSDAGPLPLAFPGTGALGVEVGRQRMANSHEPHRGGRAPVGDLTGARDDASARAGTDLGDAVLDTIASLVVVLDPEGRIVRFNKACEHATGYAAGDVLGRSVFELLVPEADLAGTRETFRQLRMGDFPNHHRNRWRTKAGPERLIDWSNTALADERGAVRFIIATGIDVTDRELAAEAARRNEQRLRAMFEDAAVGIVEADEHDRIVAANPRLCAMLGYSRDELLRMTIHDITAPEDAHVTRELNARGHTGELQTFGYEKRYLRRDGSRVWVHVNVSVVRDEAGRFRHAIGTAADITDRKRAEDALRDSEERFRSVFEQAAIGMGRVRFDDARWIDVNDAFCRMLGRSREELLATPWPEMTHPEDVDLDLVPFRRMAAGELDSYSVEKRFVHRDGHRVWAKLTLSLVRDGHGAPAYEIAIIEDVTEQKAAEQELRRSKAQLEEADRRKTEFLGILSHELRNPLAPIRNSIYLLEQSPGDGPRAARALAVIGRQAEHLTRLVDDLLDVTRIGRGKVQLQREVLDLGHLVRRTCEDHRALLDEAGIALRLDVPGRPVWANVDPTRMAQVIGNLLHNANKFTPAGGEVTVVLREGDGSARITVRDTGAGMEPQHVGRMFEAFAQEDRTLARTRGGLGLGLALAKGLVELHGGTISARSEGPGSGSEFELVLPLSDRASAGAAAEAPAGSLRRAQRRVLVIEDNADAARTLADVLELVGHRVTIARDGASGIALARQERPDAVVCDLGLPDVDGYEVARTLRDERGLAGTRLIALSGYAQPEDVARARKAGFDAHLPKPAPLEALTALLR